MIVYALLTLKLGIATRTYQIGSEPWISNMCDQNFVLSYKNQFFEVAPIKFNNAHHYPLSYNSITTESNKLSAVNRTKQKRYRRVTIALYYIGKQVTIRAV